MPRTTAMDTLEMLKQRLVIPLRINLSRFFGMCQLHIDSGLETAKGKYPHAGWKERGWTAQMQSAAAGCCLAQRAPQAQSPCNEQTAQAKFFVPVLTKTPAGLLSS